MLSQIPKSLPSSRSHLSCPIRLHCPHGHAVLILLVLVLVEVHVVGDGSIQELVHSLRMLTIRWIFVGFNIFYQALDHCLPLGPELPDGSEDVTPALSLDLLPQDARTHV